MSYDDDDDDATLSLKEYLLARQLTAADIYGLFRPISSDQ